MTEQLATYDAARLGAVLVEVYRMDEAGVDPDSPDNQDDYNADDGLPESADFPQDYIHYLVSDIVVARLMKTVGRELLLEWIDGAQVAV